MNYITEYDNLKHDDSRVKLFISGSMNKGTRVFPALNTNIKTLGTYGKYIDDVYLVTEHSEKHKQKFGPVKAFNFRSLRNHDEPRAIMRSDIVITAGDNFGGYNNAFVILLIYILLLGEAEIVSHAKDFINSLPIFIRRKLISYSKERSLSQVFFNENLYQQMVVLYGDRELYQSFLQFVYENYPDEVTITQLFANEAVDPTSPIFKRINKLQESALKEEAIYITIFHVLDQYVRKCKLVGYRSGYRIIEANKFIIGFLDYFDEAFNGSFTWLGKMNTGEDIEALKNFIFDVLTEEQRNEIYICIQNAFDLQIPEEKE